MTAVHKLTFSGKILKRGFWLYIWKVETGSRRCFYVGRTGDNSSVNAASPYSRLSQHLDSRRSASANMLYRQLRASRIDPLRCTFTLTAIGPIYPEQRTRSTHNTYRDKMAIIESAAASYLKGNGLNVLGKHPKPGTGGAQSLARLRIGIDKATGKITSR